MDEGNPYAQLSQAREECKAHADKARDLADKASNMRENGDEAGAELSAHVSQAHSLAALATAAGGGGILSIEDLGR
jgi:uncharacterized protein YlxW (UPF0749 family)